MHTGLDCFLTGARGYKLNKIVQSAADLVCHAADPKPNADPSLTPDQTSSFAVPNTGPHNGDRKSMTGAPSLTPDSRISSSHTTLEKGVDRDEKSRQQQYQKDVANISSPPTNETYSAANAVAHSGAPSLTPDPKSSYSVPNTGPHNGDCKSMTGAPPLTSDSHISSSHTT